MRNGLAVRAADIATLELERRGGEGLSDEQMHRVELDYARWRASALRFRGHLREVLATLRSSRATQLETAVRTHRDAVGDEGDPADRALWSQLE